MSTVELLSHLLPGGLQQLRTWSATSFVHYCIAERLQDARNSEILGYASPEDLQQLAAFVRDRSLKYVAFTSWLVRAVGTAQMMSSDPVEQELAIARPEIQNPANNFTGTGEAYLRSITLALDATEALVSMMERSANAQAKFGEVMVTGSNPVPTGPRSLAHRVILGELPDLPPKAGLDDPKVQRFLATARAFSALQLSVTTDGAEYVVDIEDNAQALYTRLEGNLQFVQCGEQDCLSETPTLLPDEAGLTLDHARMALAPLVELALGRGKEERVELAGVEHLQYRYPIPTTFEEPNPIAAVNRRLSGNHRISGLDPGDRSGEVTIFIDSNFIPTGTGVAASMELRRPLLFPEGSAPAPMTTLFAGKYSEGDTYPGTWDDSEWESLDMGVGTVPSLAAGTLPILADAYDTVSRDQGGEGLLLNLSSGLDHAAKVLRWQEFSEFLREHVGSRLVFSDGANAWGYAAPGDPTRLAFVPTQNLLPGEDALVDCSIYYCSTDQLAAPLSLGWWWGLHEFQGDVQTWLHFSDVADATGRHIRPGVTVTGGALFERAQRLMAYRADFWSKPAYDGLGLLTDSSDVVPVGSALLYGGSDSQLAYQYYLDVAEEAANRAATATEDAFASLRAQATDRLALQQADERGAQLGALEVEALCGVDPSTDSAGDLDGCLVGATGVDISVLPCNPGIDPTWCGLAIASIVRAMGSRTRFEVSSLVGTAFNGQSSTNLDDAQSLAEEAPDFARYRGSELGAAMLREWSALQGLQSAVHLAVRSVNASQEAVRVAQQEDAAARDEYNATAQDINAIQDQLNAEAFQVWANASGLQAESQLVSAQVEEQRAKINQLEKERARLFEDLNYYCLDKDVRRRAEMSAYSVNLSALCHWFDSGVLDARGLGPHTAQERYRGKGTDREVEVCTDNNNVIDLGVDPRIGVSPNADRYADLFDLPEFTRQLVKDKRRGYGYSPAPINQYYAECEAAGRAYEQKFQPLQQQEDALSAQLGPMSSKATTLLLQAGAAVGIGDALMAKVAALPAKLTAASSRRNVALRVRTRAGAEASAQHAAQIRLVQQAHGEFSAARQELERVKARARLSKERFEVEATLDRETIQGRLELNRKYDSYDLWRARALTDNARKLAVTARRAVEASFAVDMDELKEAEPFVEAPALWVNDVYAEDFQPPTVLGTSTATPIEGALYANGVADYVANLRLFVQGYALQRPTAVAERDTEVLQLPGPLANRTESGLDNLPLAATDAASVGWAFYCPNANAWVPGPLQVFGGPPRTLDGICEGGRPTRAKYGFWLDPWGRLRGRDDQPPFALRHNARWRRLAVNLVGAGIRDCSRAPDVQACYAEPFVRYDLRHVGPAWISSYDREWRYLPLRQANIEAGKALAAEEWLDPVSRGFAVPDVQAVARTEYLGRPLGGGYEFVLELTDDLRLERVDRIQLLVETDYWVRQGSSDGEGVRCGDGILDEAAGELCEFAVPGHGLSSPEQVCPDTCDDGDPSTKDVLLGSRIQCTARCADPMPIAECADVPDGWCPEGCDRANDADCRNGGLVSWKRHAQPLGGAPANAFVWNERTGLLAGDSDPLAQIVAPFVSSLPVVVRDKRGFLQVEGPRTNYISGETIADSPWMKYGSGGDPRVEPDAVLSLRGEAVPSVFYSQEGDAGIEQFVDVGAEPATLSWSLFHQMGAGEPGWRALAFGGEVFAHVGGPAWRRASGEIPGAVGTTMARLEVQPEAWIGLQSFSFDFVQMERGSFPSSPIVPAAAPATRAGYSVQIAAADLPAQLRTSAWSTVLVPYFASSDALDTGVDAYALSFSSSSTGIAVTLSPSNAALRVMELGDIDGDTISGEVLGSVALGAWDRHDEIEVVVVPESRELVVNNRTAETTAGGTFELATWDPTWDLVVGSTPSAQDYFFGLIAEIHAEEYGNGADVVAGATCGNGTYEPSLGETCDSSDPNVQHRCPLHADECNDGSACTTDQLVTGVKYCGNYCSNAPIDVCTDADACCPAGCTAEQDSDCFEELVSWSKVAYANTTLSARYLWDPYNEHVGGPFAPGEPATAVIAGHRYIQVEGPRTNLVSYGRDLFEWPMFGIADVGYRVAADGSVLPVEAGDSGLGPNGVGTPVDSQGATWDELTLSVIGGSREDLVEPDGGPLLLNNSMFASAAWSRKAVRGTQGIVPSDLILAGDGPFLVDFAQLEVGAFPSSPIATNGAAVTREADYVLVQSEDLSPIVREGRWALSVIPLHGSSDVGAGLHVEDLDIVTFVDEADPHALSVGVFIRAADRRLVVYDHATSTELVTTDPLTWTREAQLEIVLDPVGGGVTLSGFDSGPPADGYTGGTPWAVASDTDMLVGSRGNTNHFFGLISEPWEVPYAAGYAPQCGDGIVEADETCEDCAPEAVATVAEWENACLAAIGGSGDPDSACCNDLDACTVGDRYVSGAPDQCSLVCAYPISIQVCRDDDGCCPEGCTEESDHDCAVNIESILGASLVAHYDMSQYVLDGNGEVSNVPNLVSPGLHDVEPWHVDRRPPPGVVDGYDVVAMVGDDVLTATTVPPIPAGSFPTYWVVARIGGQTEATTLTNVYLVDGVNNFHHLRAFPGSDELRLIFTESGATTTVSRPLPETDHLHMLRATTAADHIALAVDGSETTVSVSNAEGSDADAASFGFKNWGGDPIDFAEAIIANGPTAAQIAQVEAYLMAKYGITAP